VVTRLGLGDNIASVAAVLVGSAAGGVGATSQGGKGDRWQVRLVRT